MTQEQILSTMELVRRWLLIIQVSVETIVLAYTACKIFKTKNSDWYPVTIWSLAASLLILCASNGTYVFFSNRRDNFKDPVHTIITTMVFINDSALFCEFSWGLFLISTEVQERLSGKPFCFKQKFRKTFNIVILLLIVLSFFVGAFLS